MKLTKQLAKEINKDPPIMGSEVHNTFIPPINMVEPHSRLNKGGVVYANCGASVKPAQKNKK